MAGASWCSWVDLNITALARVSTALGVNLSLARCSPLNYTASVYKYIGMTSLRSSNDLAIVADFTCIMSRHALPRFINIRLCRALVDITLLKSQYM